MKSITENLRSIKEKHGLSQDIVAEKLNKSQSAYARIERGAIKIDYDFLWAFSKLFKMKVIDVITFPEKYVNVNDLKEALKSHNVKTSITIEVPKDKEDKILSLMFGEEVKKMLTS